MPVGKDGNYDITHNGEIFSQRINGQINFSSLK